MLLDKSNQWNAIAYVYARKGLSSQERSAIDKFNAALDLADNNPPSCAEAIIDECITNAQPALARQEVLRAEKLEEFETKYR
ncbi:MAG: hypothetical protein US98_C0028G0003 [Parcubacteria group bacterium GW2011_GWC1_38_6]|nr:MAG: hypothetical protein US98_C0028G0003 [Parcubacteria group bacterium GW2011_GWC1_38_6]